MKAAVFQGIGLGHKIETVADPAPGAREIVIRVDRSGICSTDITITSRREHRSPLDAMFEALCAPGTILGHEIAGEVIALGTDVQRLKIGDKVAPLAFAGCGACLTCLSGKPDWCAGVNAKMGGYGQYALADEWSTVLLPRSLSLDDSALIEPMATSLHATALAEIKPGTRAVVVGAGPIGLGIAYFARRAGCRQIAVVARTDRHRHLAVSMGADAFLTQSDEIGPQLMDVLGGSPDVVFEASGATGIIDQAVAWLRPRGTIVAASVNPVPDHVVHAVAVMKEIRIQYAASYVMEDFRILAQMFAKNDVPLRQLITKRISLAEFPAVFESFRKNNAECKVMLSPAASD